MDDVILRQVNQPFVHIFNDRVGLILIESLFDFEMILEIALVANFSNDVTVPIAGEYLVAF